jgi:hypothetical protein
MTRETNDTGQSNTKDLTHPSLKVSLRCGCSENARQMRCTVEIDTPMALAIDREAPGRGSSTRPSRRPAANRPRHDPKRRSGNHSTTNMASHFSGH